MPSSTSPKSARRLESRRRKGPIFAGAADTPEPLEVLADCGFVNLVAMAHSIRSHARVKPHIGNVNKEVGQKDGRCNRQEDALHERVVQPIDRHK